jgi:tRNA threonylcarbamoyladenosine biosynthesis protein TsaB
VLLLALETATPRVSVAVGRDGAVLGEVTLDRGQRHAEQLVPAIDYLCRELDVALSGLAAVAVGLGPGLFTGLRVGITTATVMANALRVPVVGVPSLDLMAYPARHAARTVAAVLDARRHEVFYACYRPVPGGMQRVAGYAVGPPADLVADLEATGEDVLLVGDGVDRHRVLFEELDRAEFAGPAFDTPSAAFLVELGMARVEREDFMSPNDVRPLYLRKSDAEIEWERRTS